jgi:hypothetical protein
MKVSYRTLAVTFGALVLPLLFVLNATAQCGGMRQPVVSHSSWHSQLGQARLLRAANVTTTDDWNDRNDRNEPIVGFWHVKFVTKDSPGLPDKTEVDAGYAQWHSDGTEIMNSGGRPPDSGDFCLGVWRKVGECKYKLNHFAAAWDPVAGKLLGPANIREEVILNREGNRFTGTFTIDQYDEAGNSQGHVQGVITGTRIDVDTPSQSIF